LVRVVADTGATDRAAAAMAAETMRTARVLRIKPSLQFVAEVNFEALKELERDSDPRAFARPVEFPPRRLHVSRGNRWRKRALPCARPPDHDQRSKDAPFEHAGQDAVDVLLEFGLGCRLAMWQCHDFERIAPIPKKRNLNFPWPWIARKTTSS
jgi:hypothetical protein